VRPPVGSANPAGGRCLVFSAHLVDVAVVVIAYVPHAPIPRDLRGTGPSARPRLAVAIRVCQARPRHSNRGSFGLLGGFQQGERRDRGARPRATKRLTGETALLKSGRQASAPRQHWLANSWQSSWAHQPRTSANGNSWCRTRASISLSRLEHLPEQDARGVAAVFLEVSRQEGYRFREHRRVDPHFREGRYC